MFSAYTELNFITLRISSKFYPEINHEMSAKSHNQKFKKTEGKFYDLVLKYIDSQFRRSLFTVARFSFLARLTYYHCQQFQLINLIRILFNMSSTKPSIQELKLLYLTND